ncbi:BT1-like protein [Aureococcus anophagefferens]|nr:BT1-like protein [Aureococcus anophagefferens]
MSAEGEKRERIGISNYRELTAVLYLNDPVGVEGGAGGELRCHCVDEVRRKRSTVDVEPEPGRLVLFRSRQLLHEVLPVRQWQRVAVTLWLLLPMPRIPPAKPPAPAPAGRRRVSVRVGKKPRSSRRRRRSPSSSSRRRRRRPAPPPEVEVPAAPPPAADLDAEIRETEEKLRRLRAAREAQQQQTLAASSAAAVGDGFVSVKLAECVPASACRPSKVVWDALNRGDLVENPGGLWGVLRGAVPEAACAALRQIVLERCPLANRQPDVRGDGVAWLPLFRKDDDAWNAAFAPARELLAGVAVYDGTTMNGGYGAHRDNAFRDTVSVTENHRGAAILYLDGRPDSGTGGELRCHVGAAAEDREGATATETVDILPEPGTLVVFDSRTMLHEVRPLAGWKRVALTVWLLRRPQAGPAAHRGPPHDPGGPRVGWKIADRQKSLAKSASLGAMSPWATFSISDADHSEKVFQSIRKFGRVSQKHCDMLMDLLRRSGQTGVISVKVLGWEHVQPQLEETQRMRDANKVAITRMSSGKHKSMTWLGLDRHRENLHRLNCSLTVDSNKLKIPERGSIF